MRFTLPAVLLLTLPLIAQQTVVTCPTGSVPTASVVGQAATVVCTPVTPPPVTQAPTITALTADPSQLAPGASSTLRWTLGGGAPTAQSINQGIGTVASTARTHVVSPSATVAYTLTVSNSAGSVQRMVTVTVSQPPPTGIYGGPIDPTSLGTCSTARHDTYVVTRAEGTFRTYHPQVDSTGCVYAHEHGDNPNRLTDATANLPPPAFGLIVSKTPGHPTEPHEGYKIFVENPGAVNDEGRVNRVYSRSVFHMGTLGPARFVQPHHSAEIYVRHPEFGVSAYTQLMMDTGGFAGVCDPRAGFSKDGLVLGTCKVNSLYEIWITQQAVRNQAGQEVYRAFATPAVFDPITGFDPANPTRLLYIWDTAINSLLNFPNNDRTYVRGCDRESYAQPGYWANAGGATTYTTNSLGFPVSATDPLALVQRISASNSVGVPATVDGLTQFKSRPNRWCGNRAQLGYRN